ncbi:hypothetical protein ARMGADRAFT_352755 [Armillaria gallica]|uniref:Secreted protein n=1 Tax=Armillaria gallica TaxID=47427 RepID=A0A2H3D3K2_ARMGA|nr:hypothetical protein ARMGADRAFT_352755 [Armillaria gallica]
MTETTAAICCPLWCCLFLFTCVYKSGPQPCKDSQLSNPASHESIASSVSRLACSNCRCWRCSRSSNGTVPAGHHVSSSHCSLLQDTTYRSANTCNHRASPSSHPHHFESNCFRPRIRRRGEDDDFFC